MLAGNQELICIARRCLLRSEPLRWARLLQMIDDLLNVPLNLLDSRGESCFCLHIPGPKFIDMADMAIDEFVILINSSLHGAKGGVV